MKRISIEEFKEQSNIEIIESIMKINNGYVTSKLLDDLGIHRMYLNSLWKKGIVKKVASGIYMDVNKKEDKYYVFNLSMPNSIYSHMTALYFHGLSNKVPNEKYDITVKKGYNSAHLKKHESFHVIDDIYELGLTEVQTPMGNTVRVYDIERCICDIIRSKKRMELEHIKYSIREYLKRSDKDLVKLSNYAKKMRINDEVMFYIELLS